MISLFATFNSACNERTMAPGTRANRAEAGQDTIQQTVEVPATNGHDQTTANKNENAAENDLGTLAWVEDERDRWLYVRKVRGEAKGAWATGDFDRERNKIDIRTHEVAAFAIETSRMSINWNRPVVLGIDGSNSELKRRAYSLILFEVDQYGAWVVREK